MARRNKQLHLPLKSIY